MAARSIELRIARLERAITQGEEVTLTLLIRAAIHGEPQTFEQLALCNPDSLLIRLIINASRGSYL